VIEGEGLGGFARRLTVNVALARRFLPRREIFSAGAKILLAWAPAVWRRPAAGVVEPPWLLPREV
jgi:hypothetical protein